MARSVLLLVLVALVCKLQGQEYNVSECPQTCECGHPPQKYVFDIKHGLSLHDCKADPYNDLVRIFKTYSMIDSLEIYNSLSHLTGLPAEIGMLTSLRALDITENDLETLPDSIGNLSSLYKMHVGNNHLKALPDTIGQLSALQELNANHNSISELPASIGELSALRKLYVTHNNLMVLPATIGQLSSLYSLDVSNNNLMVLPDTIRQLSSLWALDVSSNNLTLPDDMGQMSSLEWLNVSNTNLATLPDVILSLSSLQFLLISYNHLSVLPDTIGQLSSLWVLHVSDNNLIALPDAIGQLPSLLRLEVSNNYLSAVPASIWQLSSLSGIDASHNSLKTLPWQALSVPHRKVYLSHNQISSIGTIPGTEPNFEILDLSNNNLTYIDAWFFRLGVSAQNFYRHRYRLLNVSYNIISGVSNYNNYTSLPDTRDKVKWKVDLSHNDVHHLHNITDGLNITREQLEYLVTSGYLILTGNPRSCASDNDTVCVEVRHNSQLPSDAPPPPASSDVPTAPASSDAPPSQVSSGASEHIQKQYVISILTTLGSALLLLVTRSQ